jgi:hypothetical protein
MTNQFLQTPLAIPRVKTLITTAHNQFNVATHVNDDPVKVAANRDTLAQLLPAPVAWLNQIHSNHVVTVNSRNYANIPAADASITTDNKVVLAILTADCLPILITTTTGAVIAAIHAGWRGLNAGIIQNTVNCFRDYPLQQLVAFIGPAICEKCFEIGAEVREQFLSTDKHLFKHFTSTGVVNKYTANLRAIAAQQLINLGISPTNIFSPNICSKCNSSWFYSFRNNSNCGRIATLIWLE